jgi:hypothetical protein
MYFGIFQVSQQTLECCVAEKAETIKKVNKQEPDNKKQKDQIEKVI